jgi:hypothetical protein
MRAALAIVTVTATAPAAAIAEPTALAPQAHADLGLSVVGLGYERPVTGHVAVAGAGRHLRHVLLAVVRSRRRRAGPRRSARASRGSRAPAVAASTSRRTCAASPCAASATARRAAASASPPARSPGGPSASASGFDLRDRRRRPVHPRRRRPADRLDAPSSPLDILVGYRL